MNEQGQKYVIPATSRLRARQGRTNAVSARPRISLCMIVRNEAAGLQRCLLSAAAGVDEIVIVDTGSTDRTPTIAGAFTKNVYATEWRDDFSHARNYAFGKATGEWILVLDGDDELAGNLYLRDVVAHVSDDVGALALRIVSGLDAAGRVTQEFWQTRLVRNGWYRWHGAAHEALIALRPSRQQQDSRVVITHHGKPAAGMAGIERNVRILRRELASQVMPDSRTLFYLARDSMLLGQTAEALTLFARYLAIATWDEERFMARLYTARIHLSVGAIGDATAAALAAVYEQPRWPEGYFLVAEVAYYQQHWSRVVEYCELGRERKRSMRVLFVDPLDTTYRWIIFYTNALYHTGRISSALHWTTAALEIVPDDPHHLANRAYFAALLQHDLLESATAADTQAVGMDAPAGRASATPVLAAGAGQAAPPPSR